MKTELVNIIANEAIYQFQYYKNLYLAHKKNNKIILILLSTIVICFFVIHVFYFL